mmetsp:Transcript_12036/g.13180  ORF Transcript_12036/g.13180 Transcript_12036/m.13180 type:complete len:568 (+) Transcript_12036:354-2057(+)|eukprot:CAMPEP_0170992090 /NCGR_PEP_ID=MMETSP0736-20130129/9507_1 /TAXON_ID=186038 /ORGANISM="Fragilariopsis kerguelensis, Strain L26-C5" /LENGTH=567 /DNA_ID=CAMNT_0011417423 /DNA_START=45 /DNA_END=1748 /DNA_ORIENTATION=+
MLSETVASPSKKGLFMWFKEIYSTCLLIFCSIIVLTVIFQENSTLSQFNAWVAFFVFFISLYWLSMVEGGQASLVGLPPVDMELYHESHPTTHKIMTVINRGDTIDRYLMGRQFMVLALVFVENLCAHAKDPEMSILGMPIIINKMFLNTGLAVFFMTAMIGKISAQVNASRCMLDYVNNYFAYFTMQFARAIEVSGLLHCCYPVQMFFAKAAGQPLVSKEAPRSQVQNIFFWGRVLISAAILLFAFAVTISALWNGQTTMWEGIPAWVTLVFFFLFMAIVGMLEGMQIAFFAVARMSSEERAKSTWAKKTCNVLFEGDGRNLAGFMIGRQMCVTLCFFIIARVTTVKLNDGDPNIFGVSDVVQKFFETGLLGALITTIVASIAWQLVASAFPMAFLSTPITYVLLRFCLGLEWTGLCQGSWVVARAHRKLVKFKRDEVYIGTAEERAAKCAADPKIFDEDDDHKLDVVPGHMYPGPACLPIHNISGVRRTLDEIDYLEADLTQQYLDIRTRLQRLQEHKKTMIAHNEIEEQKDMVPPSMVAKSDDVEDAGDPSESKLKHISYDDQV